MNEGKAKAKRGEKHEPDYQGAIKISTDASLSKMIAPGALVSGVQVAISASNTGGAWDNCKKEIEKERSAKKAEWKKNRIDIKALPELIAAAEEGPEKIRLENIKKEADFIKMRHDAAVVGDTVGDPLKDTSGPAINILVKLSAITSLVFGSYIKENHIWGPRN